MKVLKFGGTSVADATRVARAAQLVAAAARDGRTLVVVSAQAGVTDRLVWAAEEAAAGRLSVEALRGELGMRHLGALEALRRGRLDGGRLAEAAYRRFAGEIHRRLIELTENLREHQRQKIPRPERVARILAAGEKLSAPLLAAAIEAAGVAALCFDAGTVLRARGPLLDAEPDVAASRAPLRELLAALPAGAVGVFPGFYGADEGGRIALFGRGGSDTSAAALGAAAGASRVEIWSDVDGVLDADPRRDPGAQVLPRLSYEQAYELAKQGAKVLHAKAVATAREAGVPLVVRNSFAPERPGTHVGGPERAAPAAEPAAAELPAPGGPADERERRVA